MLRKMIDLLRIFENDDVDDHFKFYNSKFDWEWGISWLIGSKFYNFVRAFKKLLLKKLIRGKYNECNLVEGIYLFLKISKIQFKFFKFTFKLSETDLKAHYFIRKKARMIIIWSPRPEALSVLTSMNKKRRMKRKVI